MRGTRWVSGILWRCFWGHYWYWVLLSPFITQCQNPLLHRRVTRCVVIAGDSFIPRHGLAHFAEKTFETENRTSKRKKRTMAQIEKLIQTMTQRQAEKAMLISDKATRLFVKGQPVDGAALTTPQLVSLLKESAPSEIQPQIGQSNRLEWLYKAPTGTYSVTVTRLPDGLSATIAPVIEQVSVAPSLPEPVRIAPKETKPKEFKLGDAIATAIVFSLFTGPLIGIAFSATKYNAKDLSVEARMGILGTAFAVSVVIAGLYFGNPVGGIVGAIVAGALGAAIGYSPQFAPYPDEPEIKLPEETLPL